MKTDLQKIEQEMKSQNIQCEKILYNNIVNKEEHSEFDEVINKIDSEIKGLEEIKSLILSIKSKSNKKNSNLKKKQNSEDLSNFLSLLGQENKITPKVEIPVENEKQKINEDLLNLIDNQNKKDVKSDILDIMKKQNKQDNKEVKETMKDPKKDFENLGLSLGEIEKQIAMLKNISLKG